MPKKAKNFKSVQAYKNWVKAANSIPSKTQPGKSVAQASPGNTPIKVRGKTRKVNHTVKKTSKKK